MTKHINLNALQAAAEAAGGKEWTADMPAGHHDGFYVWHMDGDAVCRCFDNIGHMPEAVDQEDIAAYIALANPAAILALIDRLRKAEAASNEIQLNIIRKWPEGFQARLELVWRDLIGFIPNYKLYDLQCVLAEFGFTMKVFETNADSATERKS